MNMKALISTIEPRQTGYRVAQVEQDQNIFAVAEELFWVNCADNVVQDLYWYDPSEQTIKPIPTPEPPEPPEQPDSQGAETL